MTDRYREERLRKEQEELEKRHKKREEYESRLEEGYEAVSYTKGTYNRSLATGRNGDYVVTPTEGYILVDADSREPIGFGVHNEGHWVLTHIPTGFTIGHTSASTRKACMAVAGALYNFAQVWTSKTPLEDLGPKKESEIREFLLSKYKSDRRS